MKIERFISLLFAAALFSYTVSAAASTFPSKPIRIIVAAAPGGSTDILARSFGKVIAEQTGASVVVENRAGAGGILGVSALVKSAPDGYTVLLTPPDSVTVMPHLKGDLPYNSMENVTPIAIVAETPFTFVTSAGSPYQSLAAVLKEAREKPNQVKYGSTGMGGSGHIYTELLQHITGTSFLTAHYKGAGPAVMSVAASETEVTTSSPATLKPFIENGQIRPLFTSKASKSPHMANVPTAKEVGLENMDLAAWYGVFAPAPMTDEIANKLSDIFIAAANTKEMQDRVTSLGLENFRMSRDEFAPFFLEEYKRWGRIVSDARMTIGN